MTQAAREGALAAKQARIHAERTVRALGVALASDAPATTATLLKAGRWLTPEALELSLEDRVMSAGLCGYAGCGNTLPPAAKRRYGVS